jgi:hypothetical protein
MFSLKYSKNQHTSVADEGLRPNPMLAVDARNSLIWLVSLKYETVQDGMAM